MWKKVGKMKKLAGLYVGAIQWRTNLPVPQQLWDKKMSI